MASASAMSEADVARRRDILVVVLGLLGAVLHAGVRRHPAPWACMGRARCCPATRSSGARARRCSRRRSWPAGPPRACSRCRASARCRRRALRWRSSRATRCTSAAGGWTPDLGLAAVRADRSGAGDDRRRRCDARGRAGATCAARPGGATCRCRRARTRRAVAVGRPPRRGDRARGRADRLRPGDRDRAARDLARVVRSLERRGAGDLGRGRRGDDRPGGRRRRRPAVGARRCFPRARARAREGLRDGGDGFGPGRVRARERAEGRRRAWWSWTVRGTRCCVGRWCPRCGP